MPGAGTYQIEAIVIKKTKLGDADRILTFYTPDMGKVQGVAKGVRKPKSKLAGHLELLTHSMVLLTRGRGSLDTVTGSQTVDGFFNLKNDLELGAAALYATELVHQFGVEKQDNRTLFDLLLRLMRELNGAQSRAAIYGLLRYFEVHLLEATGYRPQLQQCVVCREPLPHGDNYFSVVSGGAVCPRCRPTQSFTYPLSAGSLAVLGPLQDADWPAAAAVSGDARSAREAEMVVRYYLRYLLERDVRSIAWLDMLRQMRPA